MDKSSRDIRTETEELPSELKTLGAAIDQLPEQHRKKLADLYETVAESTRRRRRILNLVQEALSQLRLDMKYLMFDLEATRRERDELQRKSKDD